MKKLSIILSILCLFTATGFSQQSPPLERKPPLHLPPPPPDHSKYDKDDHATQGDYKQNKYKWKKRHHRRKRK